MENFYKSVSGQRQKPESYRIHIYGLRASVECERGANIQTAATKDTNIGYRFSSRASVPPLTN